jgi:pantothenate kinase type III
MAAMLAVDVGNTNTVIGVFRDNGELAAHWRIQTVAARTSD